MNNCVETTDLLLDTAQLAALIVLESGGETSRAEEIATIICKSGGKDAEAIVLPTGAFLTVKDCEGKKISAAARIKIRGVNLYKVERANAYSRSFSAGKITLTELHENLTKLRSSILYSKAAVILASGLSAALFTLLFEPILNLTCLFDMLVAFGATVVSQWVGMSSRLKNSYQFTVTFLSSLLIALITVASVHFSGIGNIDPIIIGSIMPLLPGLSFTNAIRDTVMGDLISGTVRVVETLLIAIGIAGGVGVVLIAYMNMGGAI
ncbi:MAG: threonine/serine exporter family protein [Clostridia bacterium]|nr:threonine/serine exporter family protein [Clostridia bacterium]